MITSTEAMAGPQAVPRVDGLPVVGSAIALRRDQLAAYEHARRRHGDVVRFDAGPPGLRLTLYGVFSPDGAQRVLTATGHHYTKGNVSYREIAALLGDGMLTSEGARWLRQKRFVQPLFTRRHVDGYVGIMADQTAALVARWRAEAQHRAVVDVDAGEAMMRLALGVVGRVLFGDDLDQAVDVLHDAFPVVSEHARRRSLTPLRVPAGWPTPANRRAVAAQRRLYDSVDDIIARRCTMPRDGEDLLSLLLGARDPDAVGATALDADEVRDQVLVFLLAGHETTATALTFALHLLGRHPDVQDRVLAEATDVLGPREDAAVTSTAVGALDLTTRVVKESMRLYPSVYVIPRRAPHGDTLDGHRIPAGADVFVAPWVIHRHPTHWPDPERFDPERFTSEREKPAIGTPTSPSAADPARASASTSRCWKPRWPPPRSCVVSGCRPHPARCRCRPGSRCARPVPSP